MPTTQTLRLITLLYTLTAGPSNSFTSPMADLVKAYPLRGDMIKCPWSSAACIVDVLYSLQAPVGVFHGVLVEDRDVYGWQLGSVRPIWVLDDGAEIGVWNDIRQWPQAAEPLDSSIKRVIGHYEADNGDVYYAIQWVGYMSPTWELEETLSDVAVITDYCLKLHHNN